MSEMHYDHDQDERNHYDESSGDFMKGCLNSIKILIALLIIIAFCILAFSGCRSVEPPVSVPYGPVISVQGDRIEVSFEVINKDPGSQIIGWFYVPGHGFVKGNIFPDFTKYKHPFPVSHEP